MSASKVSNPQTSLLGESSKTKKGSIEGKENDDEDGSGERSPSPEVAKCAICLGDVVNRSRSNTCVHSFCFGCLLEWSKVKPECPLCKSSFTTIYHNYRSNTEYDEYVVPTPIPSFSIRFTASATAGNYRLSPFIRVLGASARAHQHSPLAHAYDGVSIPAGMFAPLPPPPIMPPANPFNNGSSSRPEFFGDVVNEHRRNQEEALQMPGYQNRRRRYDRDEWVQPFGSTLQPGSVVFPSVEYVRTHPAAITRLRSWLFRELNVLLGLLRSREQMAFVYDLILHLINHYDVRSRDFRDMINTYFGSRTAHFQHELYHFLLSGMTLEEYDRVADYSSTTGGNNVRRGAPEVITLDSDDEEENSSSHFTCSNSNSNRSGGNTDDDDIIILSPSSDDGSNHARSGSSPHVVASFSLPTSGRSYANAAASSSGSVNRRHEVISLNPSSRTGTTAAALPSPSIEMVQPEPERPRRHTTNRARVLNNSNVDPEMPVLEPEIFPFNPVFEDVLMYIDEEMNTSRNFSRENRSNSTIDRSRATAATATVTDSSSSNYDGRPLESRSSGVGMPSFIETAEIDLDLDVSVEPYSSPPRPDPRPLTSPDFPILQLCRDASSNRERGMSSWLHNPERDESSRDPPSCIYGNNPYSERRSESGSGSAFVPYEPEGSNSRSLSRPSRPSCIHETGTLRALRHGSASSASASSSGYRPLSPAFRVNLYPHGISSSQVMDLSRSAGLISGASNRSSTSTTSSSATTTAPAPTATTLSRRAHSPTPSTSTRIIPSLADVLNSFTASIHAAAGEGIKKPDIKKPPESVQNDSDSDEDELECLGSFPIQKKPPLAVITLSSDDEEDEDGRVKTERNDNESLNNLCSDMEGRIADSFLEWSSRDTPSIEEIDLAGPSFSSEFRRSLISFVQSQPSVSGSGGGTGETSSTAATAARTSDNTLKISVRRDPFSGEFSTGTDSASPAPAHLRKRHLSSSYGTTPIPIRKSKRLRISSSSEDSEHDNEKTPPSTSKKSLTSSSASSTPVNIPKKRKYVEFESSDSSTDSFDSDDEDYEVAKKSKRGKVSKKHSSSSSKKKSKKAKSKKSKKAKKSKSKEKEAKGKTRSGSSKTDKKGSSSSAGGSGSNSNSRKDGSSKSSPGNGGSGKSSHPSLNQSQTPASTSTSKSATSTASTSSSYMNLPLSSDLDIDESSSQTPGILDLSYHHPSRTEARVSQYSTENLLSDVLDFRVRHPSLLNSSATPTLSSTVDVSAIFGSPSRTYWDDLTSTSGRSSNGGWID